VITVDDVMDVLTQEQTEDVQRSAPSSRMEGGYFQTTSGCFVRKRVSWLALLFVGEFFTGSALRHYDHVIEAVAKLAFYVPLLISTGRQLGLAVVHAHHPRARHRRDQDGRLEAVFFPRAGPGPRARPVARSSAWPASRCGGRASRSC
jgi:hypothetical protein